MRLQACFARLGVVLVAVALGVLGFSASASAESKTLKPGGETEYMVPTGVKLIQVIAVGGSGESGPIGGGGGSGALVKAVLAVSGGATLHAQFGGGGSGGTSSFPGGSGGGRSELLSSEPLVVAGGGGGGAAGNVNGVYGGEGGSAQAGKLAGGNGGNGNVANSGGEGGGEVSPGKGGSGDCPGSPGSGSTGGNGAGGCSSGFLPFSSGGGGGGYRGGGGGGASSEEQQVAGGGGAGSSYIDTAKGTGSVAVNTSEPQEIVIAPVTPLNAGTTSCNGVYNGTGTTVQVPAGGHCTLLAGTKVTDNVQALKPGGVLVDEGAAIGGSLELEGAASIELYGGGSIAGNLVVTGLAGAPAGGDNALCATTIHGYTHVFSNGSHSPIDIGDTGACAGKPGLTSSGLMQVDGNAANITIAGNTLAGYLHVWVNRSKLTVSANTASNIQVNKNTGGVGSTLTGNTSRQACELAANSPKIEGASNKANTADTCNRTA